MGRDAAEVLARLGFRLVGLSRTGKPVENVETFAMAELQTFLARTEILVCLLPLTPATHGILDLSLLRSLNRHGPLGAAYLVNAGRGGLQKEGDILLALQEEILAGASLDVFATRAVAKREPTLAPSPRGDHAARRRGFSESAAACCQHPRANRAA